MPVPDLTSQKYIPKRNTKEDLWRLQQIYATALDNTPDFIYVIGLDRRFLYANRALLEMWGRTAEQAIGCSLTELGYEHWHAEMHHREIDQVIATKQPVQGEVPFTGTHGRRIYDYIFAPVFGKLGEVIAIVGTTRDTTARKAMEEALRASEERTQLALNSGAILGMWVWDIPQDNLAGDERFLKTFSLTPDIDCKAIPRDEVVKSIHPDDRREIVLKLNDTLTTGSFYRVEYRVRKGKNDWHWVESSGKIAERDAAGKPVRMSGILIDINDRKRIEQDLRRLNETLEIRVTERTAELAAKEARLRTIFETSYQFQGLLSLEGILLDANTTSLKAINATLTDVVNRPFADTPWFSATPGLPDAVRAAIAQVAKGAPFREEITLNLPTGWRSFDFSMRPIRDERGTVIAIIPEASEITEQLSNREELRNHRDNLQQLVELQTKSLIAAKEQAEAANYAKTEFLANMSHEIRTPMNAVMGLANILALSSPLTARQKEFIQTLQLSASALLELINDLLDISKIESHNMELERTPFNIVKLVNEAISIMTVRAREKNLTFESLTECPCVETRFFIGDPARLRQILLNLCSNAVKFTESGYVSILITCHATDRENIEELFIKVSDTGIGIPADKLEAVFHKFVQADSSITRKYGGTGLGLAITKTLVELMGGAISAESKIGQGSTFTVRIPLERAAFDPSAATTLHPSPEAQADTSPARVLLVEDYAANILVATTFLEHFGYAYDVANTGKEAIDLLADNHTYSAILMDVQMPGMNGYEATKMIREREKLLQHARTPIIGMTAHALANDRELCLSVGMDDYIAKPFSPEELQEKINLAIKGREKFSVVSN